MTPSPYLFFNGDCAEALAFYAATFGGTVESLTPYGGSPGAAMVPPDWGDKVLNALLRLGDGVIHASDAPPGYYLRPQGFSVAITVDGIDKAKTAFEALAAGGMVMMPFAPTFFAPGFGMLADRWGIPWMITAA